MIDPDEWPAYCAMCDRGFNPRDAGHFCPACIKAYDACVEPDNDVAWSVMEASAVDADAARNAWMVAP